METRLDRWTREIFRDSIAHNLERLYQDNPSLEGFPRLGELHCMTDGDLVGVRDRLVDYILKNYVYN